MNSILQQLRAALSGYFSSIRLLGSGPSRQKREQLAQILAALSAVAAFSDTCYRARMDLLSAVRCGSETNELVTEVANCRAACERERERFGETIRRNQAALRREQLTEMYSLINELALLLDDDAPSFAWQSLPESYKRVKRRLDTLIEIIVHFEMKSPFSGLMWQYFSSHEEHSNRPVTDKRM